MLGDLLELRERPVADVLADVEPTLRAIGAATAGKELVLVPGNHDYELIAPALERARRDGRTPLAVEGTFDFAPDDLAGVVAALMPDTRVTLAYPAVRIRDDVIAMHGHYLDLHLSVPRPESILASLIGRHFSGNGARHGDGPTGVDGYEAAVAPLYAFAHRVAQSAEQPAKIQGGGTSRAVWRAVNPEGRPSATGVLLSKIAIPLGVAALNRAGLGPLRADLSGVELRRAGLRAMAEVTDRLGITDRHVIFGHTHRCGPAPRRRRGLVAARRPPADQHRQLALRGRLHRPRRRPRQPVLPRPRHLGRRRRPAADRVARPRAEDGVLATSESFKTDAGPTPRIAP